MGDPSEFDHFVDAQDAVYDQVVRELGAGRKRSHWMWFIFPQLRGLGSSAMAERFAIGSLEQAVRYLKHPVLGPRLQECTKTVLGVEGRSAEEILGYPDWMKFRSSMTLFSMCTEEGSAFQQALEKYFGGDVDTRTKELLR